jgi:heptosyltransferase-2
VCATLYYDRRYALLTWPVRARRRIRLSWQNRETALLPGRHHTDEYARILLGRKDGETPRQLAPIKVEGVPGVSLARVEGRPRVVLAPAGATNLLRDDALRRWPVESYVEVAAALVERGCEVVLAGGPEDTWASAAFAGMAVTDVMGRMPLVETLALLESAEVTVTHDTGPLHLAGITSTAIVAIFGPTDPHGRLPQRENCVALWGGEGFACRPCYDGREYAACAHNGCVRQVTVAMVVAEIEAMLAARREGRRLLPRVVVPEHTPLVAVEDVR